MKKLIVVFLILLSRSGFSEGQFDQYIFGPEFRSTINPAKLQLIGEYVGQKRLMVLSAAEVREIQNRVQLPMPELLLHLASYARIWAKPIYSKFHVGEAALGKSGRVYLGVNLEFDGPFNATVHGEQFIMALARQHREEKIEILAIGIPAAPCQHCRQLMMELSDPEFIVLRENGKPQRFKHYLIDVFGPADLGNEGNLLWDPGFPMLEIYPKNDLDRQALNGAMRSYASPKYVGKAMPYGVAMKDEWGHWGAGGLIVEAAFNHSMEAYTVAAINYYANGGNFADISEVLIVEPRNTPRRMAGYARLFIKQGLNPKACSVLVRRTTGLPTPR